MKFKTTLKAVAAAVALTAATTASALTLPQSGNGGLWLTVWDTSLTSRSYTRQIGLIDAFLPNSVGGDKTPEAGLTLTFATDTRFTTVFSGSTPSTLRWNVVAGDTSGDVIDGGTDPVRAIFTGPLGASFTSPNSGVPALAGAMQNFGNQLNSLPGGCSPSCAGPTGATDLGNGNAPSWRGNINSTAPFNTAAAPGSELNFFYLADQLNADGAYEGFEPALVRVFRNSEFRATWNMDALGNLTYDLDGVAVGEIPLPAAAWLLLAGLAGLAGVGRRRKSD
jgi:hypothetical protein